MRLPIQSQIELESKASQANDKPTIFDAAQNSAPYQLSVIIPFYDEPCLRHIRKRLVELCDELSEKTWIEVIVVEWIPRGIGYSGATRERCTGSIRHLEYFIEGETFSIGAARNIGAEYATGPVVAFCDVDLRLSTDGWQQLLDYSQAVRVGQFKKRYFCVPCLYLTEQGTAEFIAAPREAGVMKFILRWQTGDTRSVQLMAPCTSFIVVDRLHFLAHGGYNNHFIGHGFEDFELHHRLVQDMGGFAKPENYYHDYGDWFFPEYKGFRALFSLIGRGALDKNVVAVHLWHERPRQTLFYQAKPKNKERLEQAMRAFDAAAIRPPPLVAREAQSRRFMFFGGQDSRSAKTLRDAFPLVGKPIYTSENDLVDDSGAFDARRFERWLQTNNIDRVLFPNPYRTTVRQGAYRWCREREFPYLVFERGALVDSWFFDPMGFNADSPSYGREKWDRRLTEPEERRVCEYIDWYVAGKETLERQNTIVGVDNLARTLRVVGKKVLFVPLQRPSDTVTVHMPGLAGTFSCFLSFIDRCAERLHDEGWVVLCKRHPFETSAPVLRWAQYVEPDTNIVDLVQLADAVALMNSGVGLYAMMMGKPCYIFAEAFYAFKGINEVVSTLDVEHFCASLCKGMNVDETAVSRFIHYLRFEFYSFGRASYDMWQDSDGAMRKAANIIDFTEIRIPEMPFRVYSRDDTSPMQTGVSRQQKEIMNNERRSPCDD